MMEACGAPAVLRVRRKRGEEPPEALFVPCKRQRREDGGEDWGSPPSLPLGENVFFKLAATVSSQHEPVPKYVREALHRQRATRALKPSCQSHQRIQQHLLARKQGTRQQERYHLLSTHRAPPAQAQAQAQAQAPQPPLDPAHTTQGHQLDSGLTTPKSQRQQGATLPQAPSAQGFHSFDSVPQAASEQEKPSAPDTCSHDSDPDVILSHAVKLMREHLAISKEAKGRQHREREQDYVYDIYYLHAPPPGPTESIPSVHSYGHDWELIAPDQQEQDIYAEDQEEEEDENSENHWGNQYPEEQEPSTDTDSSRASDEQYGSLSDEDRTLITPRTCNKYADHVLKEFDYDCSQDFDSD